MQLLFGIYIKKQNKTGLTKFRTQKDYISNNPSMVESDLCSNQYFFSHNYISEYYYILCFQTQVGQYR